MDELDLVSIFIHKFSANLLQIVLSFFFGEEMAIQKFLKLDQTEIDISNDIFFHIPVVFSKWNEYSMKIYFNSMITYFTENNIYITFLKHTVVINKTIIIINYIAYLWTNSMHSSICIALDLFDDRSYHNRINIIQHKHESSITDQYK